MPLSLNRYRQYFTLSLMPYCGSLVFILLALSSFILFISCDTTLSREKYSNKVASDQKQGGSGTTAHPEVAGHLANLMASEAKLTDYPLVGGNKVTLLIDGPMAFKSMFSAIDKAKHHIHLETFIIDDDKIGRKLADKLIESARRGVEVRMIFDAVGGLGAKDAFLQRMRENGIQLYKYHPIDPTEDWRPWRINSRHHRKILIVDGKTGFTGGLNISKVYSTSSFSVSSRKKNNKEGWRDTHVRITGPVVAELQSLFIDLWKEEYSGDNFQDSKYFPTLGKTGNDYVRVIQSTSDDSEKEIYNVYLAAINNARQKIWITQGYFSPDKRFLDALKGAAERGVDVRLLLPGLTDSLITINSSRNHYQELLESGVRIFERKDALQHAKTAVVDGLWSTVGSSNLDFRSFLHANEANVTIWGKDFGKEMEEAFLADQNFNNEMLLKEWRNRSLSQRIFESIASLFDYWL